MKIKYKQLHPRCFMQIKIPLDFIEHPPSADKLIRKTLAFIRESELPNILVDGNMVLLDGYCSYLIAKQVGVKFVKIMQVKGGEVMAEYIEREATVRTVIDAIVEVLDLHNTVVLIKMANKLRSQPTADVVEVKHGEWIVLAEFADKSICTECSICGEEYTYKKGRIGNFVHNCYAKYNYCPNCGAKMDLKEGATNA